MKRILVLGVLLLIPSSTSLLTSEGRIPLFQPTTITEPGSYVVTRDFMSDTLCPSPTDPTIAVLASPVDIDLNGFTISNVCGGPVIDLGTNRARVRNGTISGAFGKLIRGQRGDVVLDHLRVEGIIELSEPARYLLTDLFAGQVNVYDNDPNIAQLGTIKDSQIGGLQLRAVTNVEVKNNNLGGLTISYGVNPSFPISSRCVISDNLIGTGFTFLCDSGKVVRNTLTGYFGILPLNGPLSIPQDGGLIADNVIDGSAGIGMVVSGDRNRIEGNQIVKGASFGLLFETGSSGNVYKNNVARGNAGVGGATCPAPCSPDFCNKGTGNTSSGDNFLPGPPASPACI